MSYDEHLCEVCSLPSSQHSGECEDCSTYGKPIYHWPPPCCEGCPCRSYESLSHVTKRNWYGKELWR